MILNTMLEYAQAMLKPEVLCKVFIIISNICHIINISFFSMWSACPNMQLSYKISEKDLLPTLELSSEYTMKDIDLFELRFLFISFTIFCQTQKVYESSEPILQDIRIQHVCYWLSYVTTYYFISLLYAVIKEDYVICQCYPELRIERALMCNIVMLVGIV